MSCIKFGILNYKKWYKKSLTSRRQQSFQHSIMQTKILNIKSLARRRDNLLSVRGGRISVPPSVSLRPLTTSHPFIHPSLPLYRREIVTY